MKDKNFTMVGGIHVCVADVVKEIGVAQRKRVLQKINAQLVQPHDHHNRTEDDTKELMAEVNHNMANSSSRRHSMVDSTPPRLLIQPQHNDDRRGDDHDDDDDDLFLSMIPKDEGGNGGGGNGGGDDGDDKQSDAVKGHEGDRDESSSYVVEFTLVNSRNIEVKKFSGETGSNMSYMEFNENQRELVGIKGTHGLIFNKILIWVGRRGDKTITDN